MTIPSSNDLNPQNKNLPNNIECDPSNVIQTVDLNDGDKNSLPSTRRDIILSIPTKKTLDDLKQDLLRVAACCCENCLLINPEKTKLCVFGTSKLLCQTSISLITLFGKELSVAHSVKDLGVIVDKNLSFDEHINVLASD